ncbi:non-ribosomal peptide synthetase [[Kitasatospora] papulosa]|uniref:non-ribosomal peptide synthetase n=1 Tax=[Kitasatospora] papulosa TaxID=1464011 RepID=UPI002E3724F1|nr:non-ribosomal peptide synthetase [[Kitasatospora] papulosa]
MVHRLFEERVREQPDAIAVTYGDVSLTYRQLDDRVNALASILRNSHAVGPDSLVVLIQERSPSILVSMLAVLKVGGAYVPASPDSPNRRIELLLEETSARVVLTDVHQDRLVNIVGTVGLSDVEVVTVDEGTLSRPPLTPPAVDEGGSVTSEGLVAYVIFTSGTSGRPKGVMVEHRSVVNYIENVSARLGLSAADTCDYSTPVAFDLTVTTTLACLALGGSVAVYDGPVHDIDAYLDFLIRHDVTFVKLTPGYFALLAHELHRTNVQTVVLGGEKLQRSVLEKIRIRPDQDLTVHDEYGPTETTVGACAGIVYPLPHDEVPNIGRFYEGYEGHVLQPGGQPTPDGEVGELYIGGAGVARGYLNQPELTADRFLKDVLRGEGECDDVGPMETDDRARFYRTGDLVRRLPSGDFEYIGRNDDQVKIRGFRIELGEIENAIQTHGDVNQAVVVARALGSGQEQQSLIAYVVAGEFGCSEQELAQHLDGTLPPHMLPAAYVFLDVLPLTPHGKVDRSALVSPEQFRQVIHVEPRTDLEREVCAIWSELLGLGEKPVGITDDFFKLGGDSIVAIQMLSRLRQRFHVHLLVNEVLDHATVAALCALLKPRLSDVGADGSATSESASLVGEAALLPIQRWFFDQKFVRPNHWNQAFLVTVPELNLERLREAVHELGSRHGAFRLRYRCGVEGEPIQYYAEDFQPTDLVVASAGETEDLQDLLTGWQADFDLRSGPVYRVGYVDGLPDGSARVFIACHHLVVDAIGWRILTDELEALYQKRALLPLGASYGQWTEAVQRYEGERPDDRAYWQRAVEEFARTGDESLRSLVVSEDTRTVSELMLDRESSHRLLRESHHAYHTQINDLLLTAFSHALRDITGEQAHYILLEGHGREDVGGRVDVSHTVGWFTTMFPVRLTAGPDYRSSLRETKETLRAIPKKGIGYGALYGYDGSRLPRINFNYLGQFDNDEAMGAEPRWRITREDAGAAVHPDNRDGNIMTVNGWVVDGRLTFNISNKLGQEKGDYFTRRFEHSLIGLVEELAEMERTYLTPSDVDGVVSPGYLDELQADREIEGVYLANSLQQGFIYHALTQDRSDGIGDDAYIVQMMWSYATEIDPRLLREAWLAAQRTYPSLRLRFGWEDELVQVVDVEGTVDWRYCDLSHESPDRQAESLRRLWEEDRDEPYDLGAGSLFRIFLVRLGDADYSCLFSHHHSILDGWSNTVLLGFVHAAYQALLSGQSVSDAPDRGYGAAQRYLQEHHRDPATYWCDYLARYEDRMDLRGLLTPAARAGGVKTDEVRRVEDMREVAVTVGGDLLGEVRRLTQELGVTANALFLGLWHQVLACYSGSRQTITGVVVSGRNIPTNDIDSAVGLLINTLPLVLTRDAPDQPIADTLRGVQRQINELNARSTVNLSALHEGSNRLFDSLFIYENWPKISPDGWQRALSVQNERESEKLDYPLSVIVSETPDSIKLRLVYAAEIFEADSAVEMLRMQRHLLDEVLVDARRGWGEVQLLTEERRAEVTGLLDSGTAERAATGTFLDRFQTQARKFPGRIAVTSEGENLTYRALNERADRLARLLAGGEGLEPEEAVVVCMDKGIDLMVSILAVIKARGAYVLLDPVYLDERIAYILNDTGAKRILTTQRHAARLADLGDRDRTWAILALDSPETLARLAVTEPARSTTRAAAGDLMYVLYTSGTTGDPKGVMVEHGSFDLLVSETQQQYFADRESVSTCSITNHVFDIFGLEYGLPLSTGGTVELAVRIPDTLDCGPYDFVQATPTVCDVLLDRMTNTEGTRLLVGGEKLDTELLDRVMKASLDLVHVYGPTETTIWSTSWLYRATEPRDGLPVNLGKPFGGETIHVLDEFQRTLPVGAVGELHIGGGGLARGYLNRADLTSERFVTVPQTTGDGSGARRLYRTGDLVRLLPGGVLEFLGRNDAQVKIHGHRIELGEVEASILRHSEVRQAVVVVKDIGRPVLIGYYVSDRALDADELTDFLRRNLPGHMVPAACVRLAALPRTISGKLDRGALPAPAFVSRRQITRPRSRLESDLCAAIARLLGLQPEEVGIDDDFFQLGGNSILSIKLVSVLRREFGLLMTVAHLLEKRTVRAFTDGAEIRRSHHAEITPAVFDRPEDQLLSFAQERLWFIEKFERGTHAYNVPLVLNVADNVDMRILLATVRVVVERHETLRTLVKETRDGVGYQVVQDMDDVPQVPVIRVSDHEVLQEKLREDVEKVFDLAHEGPLLIRLYEVEQTAARYLAFVIHHIAFDGWSTDVLLEDLTSMYALLEQAPPGTDLLGLLPAAEIHYKDFALWQRQYLTGERVDSLVQYWEETLSDCATLELVADRPRPDHIDYRGEDIYRTVGASVSRRLRELAKERRVSLFSLLMGAHHLALRCFSNQNDIVVGVPVANRDHPQLEHLVGFFVNTLPLRVRIDPTGTVVDHIEATFREVMDLLRHQDLPFERLLTALDVPRDVSRHPIFQVAFSVQSFGSAPPSHQGERRQVLRTTSETRALYKVAKFDLSTFVDDSGEELEVNINYATSLFDRATAESFGETYLHILRQIAGIAGDEPAQRRLSISNLTYLDDARQRDMVESWGAPRRRYDVTGALQGQFEEFARRNPERLALVWKERRLTYREVNESANRAAHYLLSRGRMLRSTPVMLFLDRGEAVVTSLLAILKAGCAYLPVDPADSDDRIAFMLADSGVHTVVTQKRHLDRFVGLLAQVRQNGQELDVDVVAFDEPTSADVLAAQPATDPAIGVTSADLASLLYSSGTTGRPTGMPQTHGNVARLFGALDDVYDIRTDDVWTFFHDYVSDFAVWEMWGAFRYGGLLVIPTFEETRDATLLHALCRRERVSMLCQAPVEFDRFMHAALGEPDDRRLEDLRYVFLSGGTMEESHLKKWFQRYSSDRPRLAMGYGTAEAAFSCYKVYSGSDEDPTRIGYLLPDVAGYVLDSELRPVPLGAVGELYVGGARLTPGFLNQPDLAEARTVPNPFLPEAGSGGSRTGGSVDGRLHRSGDLVRWAPDGSLRLVIRDDSPAVARGRQTEVDEIERVLSAHPEVVQCAVLARLQEGGPAQVPVVAFYVARQPLDEAELLDYLHSTLPEHVLAIALVAKEELPRRISDRLDASVLCATQFTKDKEFTLPRNRAEEKTRTIMANVLAIAPEQISVHDDFFRLGGSSLLSIKLVSQLSAEMDVDISIAAVFQHRSVAGLVAHLDTAAAKLVMIEPVHAEEGTMPQLSFGQERLWFVDQYEQGTDAYNVHFCYEVMPGVAVPLLERSFRAIYERHEVLRTVIRQSSDGEAYQLVMGHQQAPLPVQHVAVADEAGLASAVGAETAHRFDLGGEVPFRVSFYELGEGDEQRRFVVVLAHHIAFDGWSIDLVLQELSAFYRYFTQLEVCGQGSLDLPELTIQYRDFAAWERRRISGERLGRLQAYWRNRLEGRPPLELPADRPRPRKADYRGGRLVIEFDEETTTALRQLARETDVGLFSVLLSAYYLLLQAFTHRSDLVVGIPAFNRNQRQTHDLIGYFVNSLALDFDIDREDDVRTLIDKVAARVAEAQEYQELPFERLVSHLSLPADPSRHPLFQTWFDVNSFGEAVAEGIGSPGRTEQVLLRPCELNGFTMDGKAATLSKFDLGLVINDGGRGLVCTFSYATSLFEECTVSRLAATYRSILEQFAGGL